MCAMGTGIAQWQPQVASAFSSDRCIDVCRVWLVVQSGRFDICHGHLQSCTLHSRLSRQLCFVVCLWHWAFLPCLAALRRCCLLHKRVSRQMPAKGLLHTMPLNVSSAHVSICTMYIFLGSLTSSLSRKFVLCLRGADQMSHVSRQKMVERCQSHQAILCREQGPKPGVFSLMAAGSLRWRLSTGLQGARWIAESTICKLVPHRSPLSKSVAGDLFQ